MNSTGQNPAFSAIPEDNVLLPEILALVPEYVDSRFVELRRLRQALAAADFETVESIGHNFKGTGSSFGFPQLTAAGAHIEAAARDRDRESILHFAALIERTITQHRSQA